MHVLAQTTPDYLWRPSPSVTLGRRASPGINHHPSSGSNVCGSGWMLTETPTLDSRRGTRSHTCVSRPSHTPLYGIPLRLVYAARPDHDISRASLPTHYTCTQTELAPAGGRWITLARIRRAGRGDACRDAHVCDHADADTRSGRLFGEWPHSQLQWRGEAGLLCARLARARRAP